MNMSTDTEFWSAFLRAHVEFTAGVLHDDDPFTTVLDPARFDADDDQDFDYNAMEMDEDFDYNTVEMDDDLEGAETPPIEVDLSD